MEAGALEKEAHELFGNEGSEDSSSSSSEPSSADEAADDCLENVLRGATYAAAGTDRESLVPLVRGLQLPWRTAMEMRAQPRKRCLCPSQVCQLPRRVLADLVRASRFLHKGGATHLPRQVLGSLILVEATSPIGSVMWLYLKSSHLLQ